MIQAVGIDSIEINRFNNWQFFEEKKLLRVFSLHEIQYCLSNPNKSAERFAVRFAAKEAFLKALSAIASPKNTIALLTICKNMSIVHNDQKVPQLKVNWDNLWIQAALKPIFLTPYISLTHTKTTATALIILEKGKNAEEHALI